MLSSRDETTLDDLLEAWFARRHAGERVEVDALCAEVPHLRDELERAIQRHIALIGPLIATSPEPPAANAFPPRRLERFGDYRIKRRIGRGGMSEVFLARQESLDRLVAIKVLNSAYADDTAYRLRFRREAEITGALDHPNIVPVYEAGEQDGVLFLAMKRIDGVPIDRAAGITEPRKLAAMGAQIARALHAAHEVGVTHRDVKPANILVVGAHPFVVDFGLARGAADLTLTRPGQSPGTLQFMAPEQIRGGAPSIDPRVDVYGLGATLFACLHGAPPFEAEDPQTLLQQILFEDPPQKRVKGRARDLDVILRRALRKESARRFWSALEFAEDLENLAADRPITSRPIGIVERTMIKARRHPRTTVAIALASTITIVLALMVWNAAAATELRHREQLTLARADLAAGYPSRARRRLTELSPARLLGDDVRQLASTIETRLQLDALLDQLQAERRFRDVAFLEELQARMLAGDPAVAGSKQAWIAQLVLATYGGRAHEAARLLEDGRAAAFPRSSALCRAPPGAEARALDAAGDAAIDADAALDAVAVSTLLRSREADPARIVAELHRPEFHASARLAFGKAMMALLDKRDDDAAALLGAILGDGRPHPEVQMSLARIAGRKGRIDAARKYLGLARSDLQAAARTVPLRLVLAEAEIELMHGDIGHCTTAVERARQTWDDRPELTLIESHLAALAGDLERALALSKAATDSDPLPWTWRRAMAHYLAVRVQGVDMEHPEPDVVAEITGLATELRRRARAAFDTYHEARAENLLAYVDPDPARYITGLERVLELEPGDPTASAQFVEQVFGWFYQGQPLVDELGERALRAVELANGNLARKRREPHCLTESQFVRSTLFAAKLAVALDETDAARALGVTVHRILCEQPDAALQALLDEVRKELRLDTWVN